MCSDKKKAIPTGGSSTIKLTDKQFENDVVEASKSRPILVDFWAEWCEPCNRIAPVLEDIAKTFNDKLTVYKLNIDENPLTAPKYGIRGIPTLLLFVNGEVKKTKVGLLSKTQLKEFLDTNLV